MSDEVEDVWTSPLGEYQMDHASKARWPSGLRRQTKDLVRKGVGSNPTLVIIFALFVYPVRARST